MSASPAIIDGIGFSTAEGFQDPAGLDRTLGELEDVGAGYAELSLYAMDLIVDRRVPRDRRDRLAEICRRRGLGYTVHGALSCNLMDEAHLELHEGVVRAMLELCDAVGAATLVHHPGIVRARPQPALDRLHEVERDALRRLGDVAARYGVRLAVETLFVERPDEYTADPFRLAREIAAVDHPQVCGTLDFSHVAIMSTLKDLDFGAAVRTFAPCANHLHVHDSFGRPKTVTGYTEAEDLAFGMGDLHLPIGWGSIDWDGVLPGLPLRPGTALIVELRTRYWSELAACADAARRLADLLNGGVPSA